MIPSPPSPFEFAAGFPFPVQVDWRNGSIELKENLETLGLKTEVRGPGRDRELPAGDFAFVGHGHRGLCMIGIERKTIGEITACVRGDNRLVDVQLPAMCRIYDHRYLFIEGLFRPNPHTGVLEEAKVTRVSNSYNYEISWWQTKHGRATFMWRDIDGYIATLEQAPIIVRRTYDEWQTARAVWSLYHWYTHKDWSQHKSLKGLYSAPNPVMSLDLDEKDLTRRWAKELRGIGPEKSLAVSQHFTSGLEMANASVSDWKQVPGVGDAISRRAWEEIRGIEHGKENRI